MFIQLLVDNPASWIMPYVTKLNQLIQGKGHSTKIIYTQSEVCKGDILCLLACEKIFKRLELNRHNLVVHESALPEGKGWSPLTWQILEGKDQITITLFEAAEKVDSGKIYLQKQIRLTGLELVDELRALQGQATIDLIMQFINGYPNVKGREQAGDSTYYPKRTAKDSELDPDKSLRKQFNLLRVVDNERYPAFLTINGVRYKLMISKI